mmetsp:Transcript_6574/g.16142  ORF Transcript_6574/g.16142 Transcript_6574/m.16142 type:complete len:254 (-) Transcript_6574:83-844(-)
MLGDPLSDGQQLPPPRALLVFKTPLTFIAAAYLVLLVFAIATQGLKGISLVLSEIFVLIAASFMVLRSRQCLGQCLLPFLIFAGIASVFGLINWFILLVSTRTGSHPGREDMFSSNCPYDVGLKTTQNITVYNVTSNQPVVIKDKTEVLWHRSLCSTSWVFANVIMIFATCLDLAATSLACKMFKAIREDASGGGAQGFMMNQLPGGSFGGPPAGGRGRPGGGAPLQPGQQPQQPPSRSFQTFSGQGHTVGGS